MTERHDRNQAPASWSEWLLETGRRTHRLVQRGVGIHQVSIRLHMHEDLCKLALVFYLSNDLIKLRALFEDWQEEQLVAHLSSSGPTPKRRAIEAPAR